MPARQALELATHLVKAIPQGLNPVQQSNSWESVDSRREQPIKSRFD
jgi:hypothetical protein